MQNRVRLIGISESACAFAYLGDVFACDGITWKWPCPGETEWLDDEISAWLRDHLASTGPTREGQVVPMPRGDYAALSADLSRIPLVVAGITASVANSQRRERKRALQRASNAQMLQMARRQASDFIFRRLATHGIPNINKWIIATCDEAKKNPSRGFDARINAIEGCSRQLRSIVQAERYLDPTWTPDGQMQRHPVHKALTRAKELLGLDAKERDVTVQIANTDLCLTMVEADLNTVLFNLLANSVKYAKRRTLVRVTAASGAGSCVVRFEMQSLNILPEERAVIRRILVRGSNAEDFGSGQGLGLALIDRVLSGYDGELDIVAGEPNEVERGFANNLFIVTLPASLVTMKTGV